MSFKLTTTLIDVLTTHVSTDVPTAMAVTAAFIATIAIIIMVMESSYAYIYNKRPKTDLLDMISDYFGLNSLWTWTLYTFGWCTFALGTAVWLLTFIYLMLTAWLPIIISVPLTLLPLTVFTLKRIINP